MQTTPGNGAGAYIYTSPNFQGSWTFIPGNAYCTDIVNLFGNFYNNVRSVSVSPGYNCEFYVKPACANDGPKFELDSKAKKARLSQYDYKIQSVFCAVA
ncbi:hypothetical protein ACEQ8H_007466 [Pleosporales sp. CAS-2024a]